MGQLGLDTEMADTKGFCHLHFFSSFTPCGLVTDGEDRKK